MNNDPKHAGATIEEIRRVAGISTHMYVSFRLSLLIVSSPEPFVPVSVPHYHVSSKQIRAGKLSLIVNCARTFLIEEIYRRLGSSMRFSFRFDLLA